MRKIKHCFSFFKRLLNDVKIEESGVSSLEMSAERPGSSAIKPEEIKKLRDLLQQRDNEINILVSMLKKEKKRAQDAIVELNSSGIQPRGGASEISNLARNVGGGQKSNVSVGVQDVNDSGTFEQRLNSLRKKTAGEDISLGRQEAFEIFKRDYADGGTIEDNKKLLKQRYAEAKSLGEEVNKVRNRINPLVYEIPTIFDASV
ncbi:hypothetical protein FKM82_010084 [Ascaphus truei]